MAGKSKKDGKTADWSYLEYGVCIRFLEEHIHQIAIGFFVLVLFFRKQAAHMRLPALWGFMACLGFLGTAPVQQNVGDHREGILLLHGVTDSRVGSSFPDGARNVKNEFSILWRPFTCGKYRRFISNSRFRRSCP